MTYNQSNYIVNAMDGFVMQRTEFPFLVVVVDDASGDGEQEVIKSYLNEQCDHSEGTEYKQWETEDAYWTFARHRENKNCHFLTLLLRQNLYKNPYKYELFDSWEDVKYIALCEGDDYWTDPLKLQKQVDYLEGHPDCCMCSHTADWEIDGKLYKGGCQHENSCDLTTDEVIRNGGLYLATNSLVYRKWLDEDQPEWRKKAMVGDYPLQILGTLRGKLRFMPDTMSVYRYLSGGSWTALRFDPNRISQELRVSHAKNKVLWMGLLDKDTGTHYSKAIYSALFQDFNTLFNEREIGIREYYHAASIADEKHYMRVFKDFLIRVFNPIYKTLKKAS
jgi:glycosyltransferase involved in cell wall biosynthesis